MNELLEIAKYILPSIVVLIASYLIVNKFLISGLKRKQMALFYDNQESTIRLRLQAYERLIVFLERSSPRQLLPRLYQSDLTAKEFAALITISINTEYEHNLSQQIYVSKEVWNTVTSVKEQEIAMVHQVVAQLPETAGASALQTKVIDYLISADGQLPSEVGLAIINEEAKKVLALGSI